MRRMISRSGRAACAGALIVLPFLVLQLVNTIPAKQQIADLVALFGLLWFLASAFVISLTYLVTTRRGYVLFGATLVIAFGLALGGLIIDQMPCFLGVPNCD